MTDKTVLNYWSNPIIKHNLRFFTLSYSNRKLKLIFQLQFKHSMGLKPKEFNTSFLFFCTPASPFDNRPLTWCKLWFYTSRALSLIAYIWYEYDFYAIHSFFAYQQTCRITSVFSLRIWCYDAPSGKIYFWGIRWGFVFLCVCLTSIHNSRKSFTGSQIEASKVNVTRQSNI